MLTFAQFITEAALKQRSFSFAHEYKKKPIPVHKYHTNKMGGGTDSERSYEKGSAYFNIGHGGPEAEHPEHHVWAHINGKIEKSPKYNDEEDGKTHGMLWGHHVTDRSYKGRYEPKTGNLSIVKPAHARHSRIPNHVMHGLHKAFDGIKQVHEF